MRIASWQSTTIWCALICVVTGCNSEPMAVEPPQVEDMTLMDMVEEGLGQVPDGEDPEVAKAFEEKGWRIYRDFNIMTKEPMVVLDFNGELKPEDYELIAKSKAVTTVNLVSANPTDAGLVTLSKLPTLQTLTIMGDQVTDEGIKALANCQELRLLHLLMLDELTDDAIAPLGKLPNLDTLAIDRGKLTGACFAEFADHPKLRRLQLKDMTEFTDEGAMNLAKIPNLEDLELDTEYYFRQGEKKFTEKGVRAIVDTHLPQRFKCDPSLIDDALFVEMIDKGWIPPNSESKVATSPEELTALILEGYKIGDPGFKAAMKFNNATYVSFSGIEVSDEAFAGMKNFNRAQWLTIKKCNVSGSALANLSALPLEHLAMEECELTEDHFKAIGNFGGLEALWLSNSEYEPAWLSHLSGLKRLKDLGLRDAALNDDAAILVAKLPALEEITANSTELGDKGFEALVANPRLTKIYVDSTKVSKETYQAAKQKHPNRSFYFYRYDH